MTLTGRPLRGQSAPAVPAPAGQELRGEMLRTVDGRVVNEAGFTTGTARVTKGAIVKVLSQTPSRVVVSVGFDDVRPIAVAPADVRVFPKPGSAAAAAAAPAAPTPAPTPFVPGGALVLLTAKYSLYGNQPRNVKANLQKLIPAGPVMEQFSILVTDALSSAAEREQRTPVRYEPVPGRPKMVKSIYAPKNVLTVEYTYQGQYYKQEVTEGGRMMLP